MDLQPKTEPGVPPGFGSTNYANLNEMSVSDLVSKLRTAFRFDEFDSVEKVLVARDARLKAQIVSLQEKVEVERMAKIHAEEELKKKQEQCLRGKKAEECYEKLLKEVKKNGLAEMNTIEELRNKNTAILAENRKLEELKKRSLDDSKAVAELRMRVRELEDERGEFEAKKKIWEDDTNALDALRRRNSDLEEALKKNLAENDKSAIDELRAENTRLLDEKRSLVALVESKERKFWELHERLLKLEDYAKPFMSVDATVRCENTEGKKPEADPQELKELNEMDIRGCNAGSDPFQRNEDTHHPIGAGTMHSARKVNKGAPDASATGRVGSVPIIDLSDSDDDDDDDDQTHRRYKKLSALKILKRKISFSDVSSSSSEHRPSNFRNIPSNKKSKTDVDIPVLNSLPR